MINIPINLKKNQSQIVILIVLLCAIAIILYLYLVLLPQVSGLTGILSKIGKTSIDLRSAESDISKIEEFKKDVESYKRKVDLYERRLPAEQEIPTLLENLSHMAKKSSITIVGITPVAANTLKEAGKNQIYQEFPILISAKSGYHELGSFLNEMENADRFMKVVDIEINSNKAVPKKHDVELMVCTYILLHER